MSKLDKLTAIAQPISESQAETINGGNMGSAGSQQDGQNDDQSQYIANDETDTDPKL